MWRPSLVRPKTVAAAASPPGGENMGFPLTTLERPRPQRLFRLEAASLPSAVVLRGRRPLFEHKMRIWQELCLLTPPQERDARPPPNKVSTLRAKNTVTVDNAPACDAVTGPVGTYKTISWKARLRPTSLK